MSRKIYYLHLSSLETAKSTISAALSATSPYGLSNMDYLLQDTMYNAGGVLFAPAYISPFVGQGISGTWSMVGSGRVSSTFVMTSSITYLPQVHAESQRVVRQTDPVSILGYSDGISGKWSVVTLSTYPSFPSYAPFLAKVSRSGDYLSVPQQNYRFAQAGSCKTGFSTLYDTTCAEGTFSFSAIDSLGYEHALDKKTFGSVEIADFYFSVTSSSGYHKPKFSTTNPSDWYVDDTLVKSNSTYLEISGVSVDEYDRHTLIIRPTDYDQSSQSETEPPVNFNIKPVQLFGSDASGKKTFPLNGSDLTVQTGFSNLNDGISQHYEVKGDFTSKTSAGYGTGYKALLQDINAIGYFASYDQYYSQCGGIRTFDATVSKAIGGYPKGIFLDYWDGTNVRRVVSLRDNNTYDFVTKPSYIDNVRWAYADVWQTQTASVFASSGDGDIVTYGTFDFPQGGGFTSEFTAPFDCFAFVSANLSGGHMYGFSKIRLEIGYRLTNSSGDVIDAVCPVDGYDTSIEPLYRDVGGTTFGIQGCPESDYGERYGSKSGPGAATIKMKKGSSIALYTCDDVAVDQYTCRLTFARMIPGL